MKTTQLDESTIDIANCVRQNLQNYFADLAGEKPFKLYDMVLHLVEKPMLEVVMQQADNNQSKAATWLGINRNTLHKKLQQYQLIDKD